MHDGHIYQFNGVLWIVVRGLRKTSSVGDCLMIRPFVARISTSPATQIFEYQLHR